MQFIKDYFTLLTTISFCLRTSTFFPYRNLVQRNESDFSKQETNRSKHECETCQKINHFYIPGWSIFKGPIKFTQIISTLFVTGSYVETVRRYATIARQHFVEQQANISDRGL